MLNQGIPEPVQSRTRPEDPNGFVAQVPYAHEHASQHVNELYISARLDAISDDGDARTVRAVVSCQARHSSSCSARSVATIRINESRVGNVPMTRV